jgi:glycosyltransferase involved in cell wall biosynthesis
VHVERYWYWGWWRGWQLGQLAGYSPLTLATLFLIGIWKTTWCVLARRCDLIHAYWVVPGGFIAAVAGAIGRKPVVATAAGTDLNMVAGRRLVRGFVRVALKGTDRLIAAGSDMKRLAVELGSAESAVSVLPSCFIETKPAAPVQETHHGCRFLYVGNLEKPKRVDTILRAFAKARTADASLTIAGNGTLRAGLEALASELDIADSVRFLGSLPHEEIMPLMARADVFVHCSDHEGLPVAIVEAIQSGLPVIAAGVGGVLDLVRDGENGFLTSPDDHGRFGEMMQLLMTDPALREQMAERAWDFAKNNLDGAAVIDRIEGIYRELVK